MLEKFDKLGKRYVLLNLNIIIMRLEFQDSIDRYVLGRMADEEKLEFEEKLSMDDELKEQMEITKAVRDVLERFEDVEIMERIEKMEEDAEREESGYKATGSGYERNIIEPMGRATSSPATQPSSNRKFIYWISGIAALFIVGFFLFKNVYFVEDADVAFSPCPQGVSTIRGIDSTTENLLANADYQGAFNRIVTLEDEIDTKLMMIDREINSRGGSEDEKLAYKQEELKVRQEGLSWLKVQALLGLNRKNEAIALLDKIRNSESKYKEQADSLYNMLKE